MSYPEYKHEKSREMFNRATKVVPSGVYGHLGPAEGCFIPVSKWPLFAEKAKDSYFWDVDGNKYIDYMCAYGPNVLGYCDDDVDAAAIAQLKKGNCTTSVMSVMVECAELLVDTVASADWAFFAKNGGDITSLAVLTARAHTHRKKMLFLKGYYHGAAAWAQKKDYSGILEEDVANNLVAPWLDIDAIKKVVEENKGQIAGLMAQPYDHGNFYDNRLANKEYWAQVRKICDDEGIVLIIDDVRTGFRLDLAGSDHLYGIKADLICFCKALANGYNMSALCGQEHMKNTVSGITYTGSYWLSAEPFAACIACINKMKALDLPTLLDTQGKKLLSGLTAAADNNGFNLVTSGAPALFYLRVANDNDLFLHQEWVAECVSRGVFFSSHHNHFMNASLTDDDIKVTAEIADEAFKVVRKNHPELF